MADSTAGSTPSTSIETSTDKNALAQAVPPASQTPATPAPEQPQEQGHFTHLHVHTDFSLLDGAISLDKLVEFGVKNKFKALAITDHGNVFGAVKFFQKCKKAKIKPIIGIEMYFTEDIAIKSAEKKYYHLIVLVQNETGYKNLCRLINIAYTQGFYFKPRIDYKSLQEHSEGLIVTTACLGGHIPQLLMNGQIEEAQRRTQWFLEVFGPDRFYLEIQPEDQQEQAVLNRKLYEWSAQYGVNLVATADCHYTCKEDREAHEVMLAIQTQHKLSDPDRFTFGDCRVHLRTTQEMLDEFPEHPEAIWNAGKIADMCNFEFQTDKLFFPHFEIPQGMTREEYFAKLCKDGLQELFDAGRIPLELRETYDARLQLEIDLMISMGFIEYFLVVSDFIQWAKTQGIPVGPGRGSAAGSLVSWAIKITNIDPIKYNLLFERFLNPERITMPDIDIDFCIEGREAVINYCKEKYGHDKVGQIITFGTMMAKGVIKDVARVLGLPFDDANHLSSLIPDQLKITLKEALENEPQLTELINSNPTVAKVFDLAFRLEGLTRHASKHAAGIVISPERISDVLPVYVPPKTTDIVTQYAMSELESIGFLKIDLLGLKNLTLINRAVKLINEQYGIRLDVDMLPLDDLKTFQLICQGKTSGVFQLESDGLKEVLRKLQPDKFEDIIAVNALYRPGPLGSGMVDDYIERRHGRQKIQYLFKELEDVLQETYGVIVYQEQVMKIASVIGGYSLGEADILRRAMGKKKAEVMAEQREIFMKKSIERQFDAKKAGELFDLMAYFAGYGFNKSHSAAYALIAYQTAYLKANYPAEFMACLISLEAQNAEKMSFYLAEAKSMGLEILPPNINQSMIDFTVRNGKIIFGLRGIKNVGDAALNDIIKQRENGPFLDLLDFATRIDLRTSNKRVLESLICAGAFDTLTGTRAQQFDELSLILDAAAAKKKQRQTGQMGLFDLMPIANPDGSTVHAPHHFTSAAVWDAKEKLEREKEVIGFYLSSHPLDTYKALINALSITSFETLLPLANPNSEQEPVVTGFGLMITSKTIMTKKGDKMAFVKLEDAVSSAEIIIFPRLYAKIMNWMDSYHVFFVRGNLDTTSTQCKIKASEFIPAQLFFDEYKTFKEITITLPQEFNAEYLSELASLLPSGSTPLVLCLNENDKTLRVRVRQRVAVDEATLSGLASRNAQAKLTL